MNAEALMEELSSVSVAQERGCRCTIQNDVTPDGKNIEISLCAAVLYCFNHHIRVAIVVSNNGGG
jgi:hypothetical protein